MNHELTIIVALLTNFLHYFKYLLFTCTEGFYV